MSRSVVSWRSIVSACALSTPLMLPQALSASVYVFTIDQAVSDANSSANVTAPLSGTLIGNYDKVNNPTGTMTRPGLFGGSGNMPISYSGNVTSNGQSHTNPTGSYRLDANLQTNTASISQWHIDALAGAQPSFPATFNVLYQTFRTFQPNSTFIGGITLPIPLGEVRVTSLTVTQTSESASALLTPTAANEYSLTGLVDVEILFVGELSGTPVAAIIPAVLNVTGSVTFAGATASADVSFQWSATQTDTGPFPPFVDLPLDVPTIFPSGSTAHLLISGTITSVSTNLGLDAQLHSNGEIFLPADITGDGMVNVNDLLAVINQWGACPAPPAACPADISPQPSGDGVVNVNDLLMVINNWS